MAAPNESEISSHHNWTDAWLIPVLLQRGVATAEDLPRLEALPELTLWRACIASALATEESLLKTLSEYFQLPIADFGELDPDARGYVPHETAHRMRVLPLRMKGNVLEIACDNPADPDIEQHLAFVAGHNVRLFVTSPELLRDGLAQLYPDDAVLSGLMDKVGPLQSGEGLLRELSGFWADTHVPDVPISRLVDALLVHGIRQRASDIHLEPADACVVVRFRIDGALREVARLPIAILKPLVSRMKILANLDIANKLRPQDGRAQVALDGRKVDLRVSTLPMAGLGEKVVLRILDNGRAFGTLDSLGFTDYELRRLKRLVSLGQGLVLVAGPTGSGKTTTLYSALRSIQTAGVNLVTVEDPIEYRLPGVSQVQINERAGLTFAKTLRSILRQDPDVVLVGEIRDQETAEVAVRASMTGHLVLSTLHTNDAPSTIARLIDIGVDRSALAGALRGVIAQRLVRRVCQRCATKVPASELSGDQRRMLGCRNYDFVLRAEGCHDCTGRGYKGRMVVGEIAYVTPVVERAIARGSDIVEIASLCKLSGMKTLWESALDRIVAGYTTFDEVLDTFGLPTDDEIGSPADAADDAEPAVATSAIRDASSPRLRRASDKLKQKGMKLRRSVDKFERAAATRAQDQGGLRLMDAGVGEGAAQREVAPEGPRILIADEDAQTRQKLRLVLEENGYRVIEAADGRAAHDHPDR